MSLYICQIIHKVLHVVVNEARTCTCKKTFVHVGHGCAWDMAACVFVECWRKKLINSLFYFGHGENAIATQFDGLFHPQRSLLKTLVPLFHSICIHWCSEQSGR